MGVRSRWGVRGGWALPLSGSDNQAAVFVSQVCQRAGAFLFGRRACEIFAASWGVVAYSDNPIAAALNTRPRYVAPATLTGPRWADTTVLSGDVSAAVGELKAKPTGELQVHGSGSLVRWLLDNQLAGEITLLTYPVVIGQGTRLFPGIGPDTALDLAGSRATPRRGDDPGLPACRAHAVCNGHAGPEHVTIGAAPASESRSLARRPGW